MELYVGILVAIIGSQGLWTFIGNRLDKKSIKTKELKEENKKQWAEINAIKGMTTAILKDRYMQMCRFLLGQGYITESQAEQLESLHTQYVNAGLNGWGKKLYDRCISLPLQKEDDGK